jgi:hypothetical protein
MTNLRSKLIARLADTEGSAIVIAVVVLLIVTILAGAVISVGVQTNGSTRRDANKKNALEAAEAGLQVALYRINMLNPQNTLCVGDLTQATVPASGWCASSVYSLGNGASYQYYTTPILPAGVDAQGKPCVGEQFVDTTVSERCIMAIGTSNGVTARSEVRTAAFTAKPLFPVAGVTGLLGVTMSGNANVSGETGSNRAVSLTGNANSNGIVLGPGGSFTHSGNASGGTVSQLQTPIVLSNVNPGTSSQSSLANCPGRQLSGYPACNDNYRIANGLLTPPVTPYDQSSGNVTYTASTRSLTLTGNSSLTLGGGLYNFCSISASGNSVITIAATTQAEIFIDSPDDPNSGCPAGSGGMSMSGNAAWDNQSNNPLALQLYLYGLNNGSASLSLSGNANFTGVIYAPTTNITMSGNGKITGAIAGRQVSISGNGLNYDSRTATLQATTTGVYYRSAWAQCTPQWNGVDPSSGCGGNS